MCPLVAQRDAIGKSYSTQAEDSAVVHLMGAARPLPVALRSLCKMAELFVSSQLRPWRSDFSRTPHPLGQICLDKGRGF